MAVVNSHKLLGGNIPHLDKASVRAYGKMITCSRPIYRGRYVILTKIVQLCYFTARGRPNVDTGLKSDDQIIEAGPINKVQVVVIL